MPSKTKRQTKKTKALNRGKSMKAVKPLKIPYLQVDPPKQVIIS